MKTQSKEEWRGNKCFWGRLETHVNQSERYHLTFIATTTTTNHHHLLMIRFVRSDDGGGGDDFEQEFHKIITIRS
ncbi:hypothetical protein QR98_0039020 [Sarcoptes scabiei]|uniref:Uncharacterized protein n=1 Tax=Sarcoptes scabiei TaxID=52283 RepID=A0A132A4V2_SARSC|nr:hypothetical protein QR98_0039020 [Sarcoptes scabiei]